MTGGKQHLTLGIRAEAVRLAQTSGRSRRVVAGDLGIELSTLRNLTGGRRERKMDNPPTNQQ